MSVTISSISPSSGILSGNTNVTITGTSFVPSGTTITIGGVVATNVNVGALDANGLSNTITCITPAGTAGYKDVVVTTGGGSGTLVDGYTYVPIPTISSISPSSGILSGNTSITITGTSFVPNATTVTIGNTSATNVIVGNIVNGLGTSITCITPYSSLGSKNVNVNTLSGSGTLANGYTYVPTPTISSISPSSGIMSGNTSVTITGIGFVPNATSVTIGGVSATNVNVGAVGSNGLSNTLTCITPAGTGGIKDIIITTLGGSINIENGYTYTAIPRPTINSISANLNNTVFTIIGSNFILNNTTVTISGADATNVNLTDYNNNGMYSTITCSSQVNITDINVITVTTPSGSYSSMYPSNPISNICFLAGTPVTTDQGIIAIEKINPKIHTIRKNEIVAITKTVTQDKYLVCFEKDSLGKNIPSQKTVISRNHKLFYKSNMMIAKDFINDFENVRQVKYSGEILYNVLLKEHDKMMVNNLICETLHPENSVAKLYKVLETLTPEKQHKLREKVNEYVVKNKCYSSKK